MSKENRDRQLGMNRQITRRDFLNGVAVSVGALGCASLPNPMTYGTQAVFQAGGDSAQFYPGLLDRNERQRAGLLRCGTRTARWRLLGNRRKPGRLSGTFDLVVVGGGISGLAAAYFYRKNAASGSRILILDTNDDFGGHARRNEFRVGGRLLLSNGGTQSIESPSEYK